MNKFWRNRISKLYCFLSVPVTATKDALAERLRNILETASLVLTE